MGNHTMHINSSFVDQYYKQQNILIMIYTTHQNHQNKSAQDSSSLKTAILAKILSAHTLKRVHSNSGNVQEKENMEEGLEQLKLIQNIKEYQSDRHPGYLTFEKWQEMHERLWGEHILKPSEQLWKILRLINRGQVMIPTGLAYEVFEALTVNKSSEALKNVLQSFLAKNRIKDGLSNFRELKHYPSLKSMVDMYLGQQNFDKSQERVCKKEYVPIFERVIKQTTVKQTEILNLRFKSLAEQMQKCPFAPSVSKYQSKPQVSISKVCSKLCEVKATSTEELIRFNFKASEVDFKIYEQSISDIPGASAHIKKVHKCQDQRLRVKRYLSRPVGSFK